MRVMQVATRGGPFELVERELPQPGPGEVRVKVQACGVCHSDSIAKDGLFPNVKYPVVPGHEIAGVIDAVGAGVVGWAAGTRVGVGWFGGHCGYCEPCRRGNLVDCRNLRIPGITYDGGYAEAMIAPADALALIPDELSAVEAAPLLCAGVTTFDALRKSGALAGDVVAILGIGGLGHLGVQFAAKMGFHTVAIARGAEKEPLARQLGAHVYLDSQTQDVAAELTKLGGAKTILATVTSGKAPIEVSTLDLIGGSRSVVGHASGASIDSQDTLAFSALSGVRPTIETLPLERAAEAYDKMMRNEARFRMVLTTGA
jgi:D-arabinose 1-dehydrogenase-like Zn-dependent alcohol dehydrogenase